MQDKIKSLLYLATTAPSGDNCQPWRFKVNEFQIDLYNDPVVDTSYYNYLQRASLISHGAILENISIAAPTFGFKPVFQLFPDEDNVDHIAKITLVECPRSETELAPFIKDRVTNRKKYTGGAFDEVHVDALKPDHKDLSRVKIYLINSRKELQVLSKVISLSDRLVFENEKLHKFLFDHIRWSDEEALRHRDGLDIKTLELNAMDSLGFRLLKSWPFASLAGKFGVSRAVAGNARKLAESASVIGLILGRGGPNPRTYLEGGRLMQRIWLQATSLGLGFHPMTGISFLMQRVAEQQAVEMSSKHVGMIQEALKDVALVTGIADPLVITIFRIGQADSPTVRSQRKDIPRFMTRFV